MTELILKNEKIHYLLLFVAVALTRVPFLFDGFGHEEDSWGLVVNAWEMKNWGHYVASRFPGHPLQEYVYLLIWDRPAWVYNLFSALASIAAVHFLYGALKNCGYERALEVSLLFAFTPVFVIAGTYTIDYAWSICFVLGSFYLLTKEKYFWSGIVLGMAVGCRITSGAFIIPWAMLLFNRLDTRQWIKDVMILSVPAVIVGVAWYIPAYLVYGRAFFDYSDQFPYPPAAKIIYKATLGVFGLLGGIALVVMAWSSWKNRKKTPGSFTLFTTQRIMWVCAVIIILQIFSYLRLPQKAGYMIPLIPFVLLFLSLFADKTAMRISLMLFILSPFLFSINLTDPLRGAEHSNLAFTFRAAGQEIFLDPLSGPILSERSKRRNKMDYCEQVLQQIDTVQTKQALICGWWYNELYTEFLPGIGQRKEGNTKLLFYSECATLDSLSEAGYKIYYLPEQNLYNDQMFGQECTDAKSLPFPVQ